MPNETPAAHPAGEYAIVELLGHMTLVGRIAEAERFGAKMMVIEPIFPRLAKAVIEAHIAEKQRDLSEACIAARIELEGGTGAPAADA